MSPTALRLCSWDAVNMLPTRSGGGSGGGACGRKYEAASSSAGGQVGYCLLLQSPLLDGAHFLCVCHLHRRGRNGG